MNCVLAMCRDQLAGNDHFAVHPRKQDEFLVTHYAGDVNYSTAGFLDKNKDMLNIGEYHTLDTEVV
jgi:myosin heavy subunit